MSLLVFGGQSYYPSGGAGDFLFMALTVEGAIQEIAQRVAAPSSGLQWVHIWDSERFEMVDEWANESAWYGTAFVDPPVADDRLPTHTLNISGYAKPQTYSWWHWPARHASAQVE